jgi:hypothetical protein
MFHPIRVDHTDFFQVVIKTLQFNSEGRVSISRTLRNILRYSSSGIPDTVMYPILVQYVMIHHDMSPSLETYVRVSLNRLHVRVTCRLCVGARGCSPIFFISNKNT